MAYDKEDASVNNFILQFQTFYSCLNYNRNVCIVTILISKIIFAVSAVCSNI